VTPAPRHLSEKGDDRTEGGKEKLARNTDVVGQPSRAHDKHRHPMGPGGQGCSRKGPRKRSLLYLRRGKQLTIEKRGPSSHMATVGPKSKEQSAPQTRGTKTDAEKREERKR